MKDIFRKSLKTALVFAAVGALVALTMPFVMQGLAHIEWLSAASIENSGKLTLEGVLHTTGVFTLFGALEPVVGSAFGFIFGEEAKAGAAPPMQEKSEGKAITIHIQAPAHTQQQIAEAPKSYRKRMEIERLSALSVDRLPGM